jgi:hypothetical protein
MNERIKELADQAGINSVVPVKGSLEYVSKDEIESLKKFAELIVKECANVLRAESERLYKLSAEEKDELFASNFEICAEKCVDNVEALKDHFGVKE